MTAATPPPRKRPAKKSPASKKVPAKRAPAKRAPKKAVSPPAPVLDLLPEPEPEPEVTKPVRLLNAINFKAFRDVLLFLSGLSGVFYETVFVRADRPDLLLLFASMVGLPAFLRTDENRKK